MKARLPILILCLSSLVFTACPDTKVTSYRVPKEKEPTMPVAAAAGSPSAPTPPMASAAPAMGAPGMAGTPVATATGTNLTWTAPAHWKTKAASAMRKGTYTLPGDGGADAELAITAFPGDVGGELANVNRWRGQIQLPPVGEPALATAITRLEKNGLKIAIVDAVGPGATPQHLLGAMIPFGGATWFFKITGPDATVTKEKSAFLSFLDSIKPAATP